MQEIIRNDIRAVLADLQRQLSAPALGIAAIKALSDKVIHNASIFQDEDSVSIAILMYALSKVLERTHASAIMPRISSPISNAVTALDRGDDTAFRDAVKKLFQSIRTADEKISLYIEEAINQAQVKKGSKLCAHCISIERASKVLGITQWELLRYIGKTTIMEGYGTPLGARRRLLSAKKLFNLPS